MQIIYINHAMNILYTIKTGRYLDILFIIVKIIIVMSAVNVCI